MNLLKPLVLALSATVTGALAASPSDSSESTDMEIISITEDAVVGDEIEITDDSNGGGLDEGLSIEGGSPTTADVADEIEITDDSNDSGLDEGLSIEEETPDEEAAEQDNITIDQSDEGDLREEEPVFSDTFASPDELGIPEVETEEEAERDWTDFARYQRGDFSIGLDAARLEYGHLIDSDSDVDTSNFGHLAFSAQWQPDLPWEARLGGRLDGYYQSGDPDTDRLNLDYGESFLRYRGENFRLTAGTQTVIWGRIDELPPTDRISRRDLARGPMYELPERRRSMPVVRFEGFQGDFKLDAVALPFFRRAYLPNKKDIWSPVNQEKGEIIGVESTGPMRRVVKTASVSNHTPSGNGGFGVRLSRTGDRADYALTVQRVRQSAPYYKFNSADRSLQAKYPRSWVLGGDLGFEAMNATWRFEAAWLSDKPATRSNLRYTTVDSVNWGAGVQFYPGDGDVRVNLQIVGDNMLSAPDVRDQENRYNFNGSIEGKFASDRWRATTRFFFGLDQQDIYINPEIAFIAWEPQEVYLALHYFHGNNGTIGGFYDDNSMVTLGWRASF